jgi:inorganic pyrophosphatase
MTFNYGFFPQTWENPDEIDPLTNLKGMAQLPDSFPCSELGDGDPLDVVEIGIFPQRTHGVAFVKVIGAIGLIDEGETDWKIIAVDVNDPKAHFINGTISNL